MATPFVQGRLRDEPLEVCIETECGHCGEALHIVMDSELGYRVEEAGAEPMVFSPQVDWQEFDEPNIIHAY